MHAQQHQQNELVFAWQCILLLADEVVLSLGPDD